MSAAFERTRPSGPAASIVSRARARNHSPIGQGCTLATGATRDWPGHPQSFVRSEPSCES
jgi:hypothetical protein